MKAFSYYNAKVFKCIYIIVYKVIKYNNYIFKMERIFIINIISSKIYYNRYIINLSSTNVFDKYEKNLIRVEVKAGLEATRIKW